MDIHERSPNHPLPDEDGPDSAEAASGAADRLPLSDYDRRDHRDICARLPGLSQVELAAIEPHERSHKNREEVLAKLRYLRMSEPLPGYDALSTDQITTALGDADAETVRSVRDYERKFQRRPQVMKEAARVLPTSPASAREDRAREETHARVRDGLAGRAEAADGIAGSRSAAGPEGD